MIIISILSLLLSASVTLRRDMSILFNRVTIIGLIYCILYDTMCLSFISKGIGLHGGLCAPSEATVNEGKKKFHLSNISGIYICKIC